MKFILNLVLIYCLIISQAFGQATNPNDVLKLGDKSSSSDKGITFETGDGVSNKKLLVEKISKKLKWNGNSVQIGDGSASSDKEIVIAGALKSLKYNGTSGEFEFNDDVKLVGSLKADILQAINSEVDVKSALRAELGVKFGTGNAEIKYDTGLNSLVFSNDGTLYKKVGSGSGGGDGGVSILKNGSFEDGSMNWTNSGGTYAVESYTNGTENDLKYAKFTATSASQTLCSDLANTPSYFGAGGMIDFTYTGTGTAFLAYVVDGSGNKLTAPQALLNQTAWTKLSPIPFYFNTSQKLCFESASAGEIKIDKSYLGSNKGVGNLIGFSKREGQFKFASPTGRSIGVLPITGTDVNNGFEVSGNSIKILESGYYTLMAGMWGGGAGGSGWVTIMPRKNSSSMGIQWRSANNSSYTSLSGFTTYYLDKNDLIEMYLSEVVETVSGGLVYLNIQLAKPNTDTFQTPEASQWFIDANIGGANPSISNSISSYSEITNASLDLVLNTGSSQAQIACASGTDSTGLTCSSNESIGITFQNPYSGYYEACFDYTSSTYLGTSSSAVFQVVQTSPLSSVIVQEGKSRLLSGGSTNAYTTNVSNPNRLCGTFLFNDTSRKTIRLMYEASVATNMSIIADRLATEGQRDIHITVRPLLQNSLRAILTGDQVTTPNVKNPEIFSFSFGTGSIDTVCSASPCSYLDQIGDKVTSVVRNATGSYRAYFNKTYSKLKCTKNAYGTSQSSSMFGVGSCSNCSSVLIKGVQATTNTDMDIFADVICHGY